LKAEYVPSKSFRSILASLTASILASPALAAEVSYERKVKTQKGTNTSGQRTSKLSANDRSRMRALYCR